MPGAGAGEGAGGEVAHIFPPVRVKMDIDDVVILPLLRKGCLQEKPNPASTFLLRLHCLVLSSLQRFNMTVGGTPRRESRMAPSIPARATTVDKLKCLTVICPSSQTLASGGWCWPLAAGDPHCRTAAHTSSGGWSSVCSLAWVLIRDTKQREMTQRV